MFSRRTFRLIAALALLAAALAALGSCRAHWQSLTRGLPDSLPAPVAHAGVRPGVVVQLEQYDDALLAATLDAIAETPFRYLRQTFHFTPDFDWAAADRIMAAVAAQPAMRLVPLLDGDPATRFAPPDPAAFAAWSADFATRYGDQIDYYIIWDEPNLASHWGGEKVNPDEYAALLAAAGAAIKSADPTAWIVAAPLAPTTERENSLNLADPLYLQALYAAEAPFDVAAAKPYGFDHPSDDRTVDFNRLNFSRAILLREVMVRHGDAGKALWAGNWGWNHLPEDWQGAPSIWGEVTAFEQQLHTANGLRRARAEWPWMGVMFLENWEPAVEPLDPRQGFSIAQRPLRSLVWEEEVAYPGFHLARLDGPGQVYTGDWRFSAEFGADSSEKYAEQGQERDRMTFTFWGTDVGVRVRRADYRARFYVTVNGEPANALPRDEHGAMLVLDAPNPHDDFLTIIPLATGLPPGLHTVELIAHRGWGQWALNGFSVAWHPPRTIPVISVALWSVVALAAAFSLREAQKIDRTAPGRWWQARAARFGRLRRRTQLLLISAVAALLSLTGWLTWGQQAAGIYRRLGDGSQLALTAGMAAIFWVAPSFILYLPLLLILIGLISFRPAWGLALIAFSMPFYARSELLKTVSLYRFSPTEIFTLATLAGFLLWLATLRAQGKRLPARPWHWADGVVVALFAIATLSLPFTGRLDVALNEWRTLMLEATLFYGLLRLIRPKSAEMAVIVDAFVLSAVVVALYGLGQLLFGVQAMITAEGGLPRVQSLYGSPNNVALYLGRVLPIMAAVALWGDGQRRRWYGVAALLCGVVFLATFSKGGLLLGAPAAAVTMLALWRRQQGGRGLAWALAALAALALLMLLLMQAPALAARLDPRGDTSFIRLNLWRSSLEMVRQQPLTGVGLDNFLYEYRGRYIMESAWREPNLNHPHNLALDFATRLGIPGLLAGLALAGALVTAVGRAVRVRAGAPTWQAVAIGLAGSSAWLLAHGLVDHSFFLIDLAFTFYLLLALALWRGEIGR
jgi:O-antigen ligase